MQINSWKYAEFERKRVAEGGGARGKDRLVAPAIHDKTTLSRLISSSVVGFLFNGYEKNSFD